jgi:RNA polymerase sigma-70 factor, ECF subfamily
MADPNKPVDQIVREIQAGIDREENFYRLFEQFHSRLERFFARYGFLKNECEDLTQEVFLRVFKNVGEFRWESPFGAWITRIADNLRKNQVRRQHQAARPLPEQMRSLSAPAEDEAAELRPDEEAALSLDPEQLDRLLEEEGRDTLRQAIAELPEQMRQCMFLRAQDLKYHEIAVVMNLSVETVKVHLFKGRKRLKTKLTPYYSERVAD